MPACEAMSATEMASGSCTESRSIAARTISGRRDGRFAGRGRFCSILCSMASRRAPRSAGVTDDEVVRVPPHRPSRRLEIVEAAIRVFAECPLSETTVEQMAAECGVAVTAVYYHFSSKEELFDEAFKTCLLSVTQTIDEERSRADTMDSDALREVIYASWAWFRTHPVEARFFTLHSGGATPESRRAFDEWQEFHARRAFDYLPEDERPVADLAQGPGDVRRAAARLPLPQPAAQRRPDRVAGRTAGQAAR